MGIARDNVAYMVRGVAGESRNFGCWLYSDPTQEHRWRIISDYMRILDGMRQPIASESALPCGKEQIKLAIFQEVAETPESEFRNILEIAYVQLECFIPHEDFRVIEEFKNASELAQEMASNGDPKSILKSARMMRKVKGEKAVEIEEKISERMRRRHLEIQEAGKTGTASRI